MNEVREIFNNAFFLSGITFSVKSWEEFREIKVK